MLERVLEPEVMDTPDEATDYDSMDHSAVNRRFAADFLALAAADTGLTLDVGTGTAQIPIELCRQSPDIEIVAVDLADEMLKLARRNVERAGFADRIRIEKVNGRRMDYPPGHFPNTTVILTEPEGKTRTKTKVLGVNSIALFWNPSGR